MANILRGKQISLDSHEINWIFKLPIEGIIVPAQEVYNEGWLEYFEGGKEKHYKLDSRYILAKVCTFGMRMRLTTLVEVATFQQGNRYILGTLLSTINATRRSTVN